MSATTAAEETLWTGRPSPVVLIDRWIILLVALVIAIIDQFSLIWTSAVSPWIWILVLVALLWLLIVLIPLLLTRYTLTNLRFMLARGLITRRTDQLELVRVRDIAVVRPFWLLILGLGHIDVTTADVSNPHLRLVAVPHPITLADRLRHAVREVQKTTGYREMQVT